MTVRRSKAHRDGADEAQRPAREKVLVALRLPADLRDELELVMEHEGCNFTDAVIRAIRHGIPVMTAGRVKQKGKKMGTADFVGELVRQFRQADFRGRTGARVQIGNQAVVVKRQPERGLWPYQVFNEPFDGHVPSEGYAKTLEAAALTAVQEAIGREQQQRDDYMQRQRNVVSRIALGIAQRFCADATGPACTTPSGITVAVRPFDDVNLSTNFELRFSKGRGAATQFVLAREAEGVFRLQLEGSTFQKLALTGNDDAQAVLKWVEVLFARPDYQPLV